MFARSAYRLELLDGYDSPRGRERLTRFLAGQPDDPAVRRYWDDVVTSATAAGKTMSRVHVATEPLTDYLRFEFSFYAGSVTAGEDIRILSATAAARLDLPDFDYWFFDGERVGVMYYGERGVWLRTEIVTEPDFAAACQRWRDLAVGNAIPLHDYPRTSAS